MANSWVTDQLETDWTSEKSCKQKVIITWRRYCELSMLENTNFLLQKKVDELLIKTNELQNLIDQKMVIPTKKNKKIIKDVFFK